MPTKEVNATAPRRLSGRFAGIAILLITVGIVIGYFVYQTISPSGAALMIEANPTSIVYINGEQRGRTPLEVELRAREVEVKIAPESTIPLSPYQTKVELTEGVKTIVRRNFGEGIETASGQIISFEKQLSSETSIAIVSNPDGVAAFIDDKNHGVTPLKVDVSPGVHSVSLSSPGFVSSTFEVKATSGYKLTVVSDLARDKQETGGETKASEDSKVNTDEETETEKVKISDTPLGYLRVRSEPSVDSEEVSRVFPGKNYVILEHDEKSNWYKIELPEDEDVKEGWVSGEFAQIVEE